MGDVWVIGGEGESSILDIGFGGGDEEVRGGADVARIDN